MANPHRGEVTVQLFGQAYTLRPTFHIISTLEERIGLRIEALALRAHQKGLLTGEMMMILAVASRHDGSQPLDTSALLNQPADDVNLHELLPDIAQFLQQAAKAGAASKRTGHMAEAYQRFGLTPDQFWQMTPAELEALAF